MSSLRLRKLIINPLVASFQSLFKLLFPHPLFKLSSWTNQSQKNLNCVACSYRDKKKEISTEKFWTNFCLETFQRLIQNFEAITQKLGLSKKKRLELVWEKQHFQKTEVMCYVIFVPKPFF